MKKTLSLILALVIIASLFAGCGDKNKTLDAGNFVDVDYKANEEALKYSDSSEMPDWKGDKLELTMWYANGSYNGKKNNIAENDVVDESTAFHEIL